MCPMLTTLAIGSGSLIEELTADRCVSLTRVTVVPTDAFDGADSDSEDEKVGDDGRSGGDDEEEGESRRAARRSTPALRICSLRMCSALSGESLSQFASDGSAPKLEQLDASGCGAALGEVRLTSRSLRELKLVASGLVALSVDAPLLSQLSIYHCRSLLLVSVTSEQLSVLDLSCLPLRNVHLACPGLTTLLLDHCALLTAAGLDLGQCARLATVSARKSAAEEEAQLSVARAASLVSSIR
jgi:hypothetical protein